MTAIEAFQNIRKVCEFGVTKGIFANLESVAQVINSLNVLEQTVLQADLNDKKPAENGKRLQGAVESPSRDQE